MLRWMRMKDAINDITTKYRNVHVALYTALMSM
jgi:hypothetical protein